MRVEDCCENSYHLPEYIKTLKVSVNDIQKNVLDVTSKSWSKPCSHTAYLGSSFSNSSLTVGSLTFIDAGFQLSITFAKRSLKNTMGWVHNVDGPLKGHSSQKRFIGVTTGLFGLAIIAVCLRIYVRTAMVKSFGKDDIAIIFAIVSFLKSITEVHG